MHEHALASSSACARPAQVFGKVMVCKDMETALKVSRTAGHLSCVTIKGDQVSKKGTMTGGYIDPSRCGL